MILIRYIIKEADKSCGYLLPQPFDSTRLTDLQTNPTEVAKLIKNNNFLLISLL